MGVMAIEQIPVTSTENVRTCRQCAVLFSLLVLLGPRGLHAQVLKKDYYSASCPKAEHIVREVVDFHFKTDRTIAASLLRLHFHDAFVQGCDGSVLLDVTSSETPSEKSAMTSLSLGGFDVIDDAKAQIEKICPGIVSCADILALAARDAVVITGGPFWGQQTGRLDGKVSIASEVNSHIPQPNSTANQIFESFMNKGLTRLDLVALVGAHTIGRAHCGAFSYRLRDFSGNDDGDKTLDAAYLAELKKRCPQTEDPSQTTSLDRNSEFQFDTSFYRNLERNCGLLQSDQEIANDESFRPDVQLFAADPMLFAGAFASAMEKLGRIGLKGADEGEIRFNCRETNRV